MAVNDGKGKTFGVDNTLVFAKGTIDNYKITKVLKINFQDETSIDIVGGYIYESKGIVGTDYFDGLLEEYNAKDFQYGTQRERGGRSGEGYPRDQDGRRIAKTPGRASIDVELDKKTSELGSSLVFLSLFRLVAITCNAVG